MVGVGVGQLDLAKGDATGEATHRSQSGAVVALLGLGLEHVLEALQQDRALLT